MFRNISSKILLLFFLTLAQFSHAKPIDIDTTKYIKIIDKYNKSQDTVGLYDAFRVIDFNFEPFYSSKLISRLLVAARITENNGYNYLSNIFSLINHYYSVSDDQVNQLEYLLRYYSYLRINNKVDEANNVWVLIDIGNIYFGNGLFQEAREFYKIAENLSTRFHLDVAKSVVFLNYGLLASRNNEYPLAISYFNKSLLLRENVSKAQNKAILYLMLGRCYSILEKADSVLYCANQAKRFYSLDKYNSFELKSVPAQTQLLYYNYYYLKGDNIKANYYLKNARESSVESNFKTCFFNTYDDELRYAIKAVDKDRILAMYEEVSSRLKEDNYYSMHKQFIMQIYRFFDTHQDETNQLKFLKLYNEVVETERKSSILNRLNISKAFLNTIDSESKINYYREKLNQEKHYQETQNRNRIILIFIIIIGGFAILFLFRLTTKLKMTQEELTYKNDELLLKTKELEDAIIIKDKLFSIIAHDLRNPLHQILLEIANLKNNISDKLSVIPAERAVKKTIDLFEKLLQWAKLDRQIINSPMLISIKDSLDKVISFFVSDTKLRSIYFYNTDYTDISIFADPNIIQTVFRNICSNAIAAVHENGIIEVNVVIINEEKIQIIFSDSGKGFPEHIVENFMLEHESNSVVSSGFGLKIVREIVTGYKWNMSIDNQSKHGGARVLIELPYYSTNLDGKSKEVEMGKQQFKLSEENKIQFGILRTKKVYQVSDVRNIIKEFSQTSTDEAVIAWFRAILDVLESGDADDYLELMKVLD